MGSLLAKDPNVRTLEYNEGQSLSKLWNQLIINSTSDKIFILNDDIKISPGFRKEVENSGVLDEEVGLLNKSWSHFLISKKTISNTGWFDERFPGVGNEDEDYEARLVMQGILVRSYPIISLKSIIFMTSDFSYSAKTPVVNKKYVKANKVFFESKWETSENLLPDYQFVRIPRKYVKLRSAMETPNFYPGINYGDQ